MKEVPSATLVDIIAALSHDLRSTLSSASLAAGLMSTHADADVQGFSQRLGRTVQTQTALLNIVAGLVESLEGDSQDMTLREFCACLEAAGVEVRGKPAADSAEARTVRRARPIALALARLLKGASVDLEAGDDVTLATGAECEPPVSRSTPHVILKACGVRTEPNENGTRFVLEA